MIDYVACKSNLLSAFLCSIIYGLSDPSVFRYLEGGAVFGKNAFQMREVFSVSVKVLSKTFTFFISGKSKRNILTAL
jgi:hypothetical protein